MLHSIPTWQNSPIYICTRNLLAACSIPGGRTRGKEKQPFQGFFMPFRYWRWRWTINITATCTKKCETRAASPSTNSRLIRKECGPVLVEVLFRVVEGDRAGRPSLLSFCISRFQLLELSLGQGLANFHLVFLLRLLHYLGIFPNSESIAQNSYFDMLNGVFVPGYPCTNITWTSPKATHSPPWTPRWLRKHGLLPFRAATTVHRLSSASSNNTVASACDFRNSIPGGDAHTD